ncbi:NUDIX domain-containing protein [Paeniroseomonas aquatica]|uniref:NUDIX domain-containing protein n=1 Tax=Paeniroseomonas aquatica TaxID=373043 RepID=A0ABT8A1N7_9PROT|nr:MULTISPECIES: NUDIX domain-containing protein [Acetobacteraceae]MDN3563657.1 NUDIX domain-containing protein [Paeniroseomonas aquatica]
MSASPASPVSARAAATVLLLRDRPQGMEVFMVVRHHEIDFASGALVFPGGRVDPDDAAIAEALGGASHATPIHVAAVRETFEECGVLLARRRGEQGLVGAEVVQRLEAPRAALCRREAAFADILAAEDLVPATDLLVHFAHWITPRTQPKRFDTHFFLTVAPEDHLALHDGGEAVDSVWIRPADALDDAANGRRKMIFPTRINLMKLARETTAEASIGAARSAPVITVEPEFVRAVPGGRELRIPLAAGYGGEIFLAHDMPASGGAPPR